MVSFELLNIFEKQFSTTRHTTTTQHFILQILSKMKIALPWRKESNLYIGHLVTVINIVEDPPQTSLKIAHAPTRHYAGTYSARLCHAPIRYTGRCLHAHACTCAAVHVQWCVGVHGQLGLSHVAQSGLSIFFSL
jgi:hypothetical protein